MTTENKKRFELKDFTVEYKDYGTHQGKYLATIKFRNGDFESFTINIPTELSAEIVQLILASVQEKAAEMVEGLVHQLQLQADGVDNEPENP